MLYISIYLCLTNRETVSTANGQRSTNSGLWRRASGRSLRLLRGGPAGLREGSRGNRKPRPRTRASGIGRRVAACGCCGAALRALLAGSRGNRKPRPTVSDSVTAPATVTASISNTWHTPGQPVPGIFLIPWYPPGSGSPGFPGSVLLPWPSHRRCDRNFAWPYPACLRLPSGSMAWTTRHVAVAKPRRQRVVARDLPVRYRPWPPVLRP